MAETSANSNVAVLVLSCDKYADVWPPFYTFFFKYWPDCPYKIYHGSNYARFEHPKVTSLVSSQETDWSTETKSILKQIEEEYVIIILEDYFIYQPVDTKKLQSALGVMKKENAIYTKIACWPSRFNTLWEYDKLPEASFMGKIKQGMEYKICLQTAAWNRKLLIELLKDGESPWQFEVNGSKRTDSLANPCLCLVEEPNKNYTHGPITYLCSALTKGVWMRDAINLCRKENVALDLSKRKVETRMEYLVRRLYTATPLAGRKYFDYFKMKLTKPSVD